MILDDVVEVLYVKWWFDLGKLGKISCVGDIGIYVVYLVSFVSQFVLIEFCVEFYVCGFLKFLEDMFFVWICYGDVLGMFMVICFVFGNCGGFCLCVFGFEGGLEWDFEDCDWFKFNCFGELDCILSWGYGYGVLWVIERFVCMV